MKKIGQTSPEHAATRTGQKPYQAPRILSRESLEAIATTCAPGKTAGADGDCASSASS